MDPKAFYCQTLTFKLLQVFCVTLLVISSSNGKEIEIGIKSHDLELSENYVVHWDYDAINENVTFELTVKTTGYVGFGISPTGDMTGADIVIGGVRDDGVPYFEDRHGVGKMMPVLDSSQDYHLISAWENATHTYLKFWRILTTCDDHDYAITIDTQKLIWSFGLTDEIMQHSPDNRGTKSTNILDPDKIPVNVDRFEYMDMTLEKSLPEQDTSYWCTIHRTPNFTGDRHMTGFDVVLNSKDAIKHTHHIDIYECDQSTPENIAVLEKYLGDTGADCYYPDQAKPDFPSDKCKRIQYGWAIGGEATIFPEHAGFPFLPNTFYMMEVHYDNPTLLNVSFTTGMRIYYTNETRENDAAYLLVGSQIRYTQMLPPRSTGFVQVAHCSQTCTNYIPEEGLNVFAFLLHAHTSARALKVRIFRDGVELPWILNDQTYDFNFQQNRLLREEFKLYRGDHITVECLYDTNWKNGETTIGGRSTREEMCEAFFFYYPKMPEFIECLSEYPSEKLLKFLGIDEIHFRNEGEEDPTILAPEEFQNMTFSKMISTKINWTDEHRKHYQQLHRFAEHEIECFPASHEINSATYPNVTQYVPEDLCPNSRGTGGSTTQSLSIRLTLAVILVFSSIKFYYY